MTLRHHGWIVILVAMFAAACGSTHVLDEEDIPGDFVFSYEMTATDEEAFLKYLAIEEEKYPEAEQDPVEAPAVEPSEDDAATDAAAEAEAAADSEGANVDGEAMAADGEATAADGEATAADGEATAADGEATAADGEAMAADGEATAADGEAMAADGEAMAEGGEVKVAGPDADVTGLKRTFIYLEIRDPGRVKYEVHFGFGVPVKRAGSVDLSETAFRKIYAIVRQARVFELKKRYVGQVETGRKEIFIVKGNLKWQVIDVKNEDVPELTEMWQQVKAIILDKHSRIFDNPEERADIYVLDKRSGEFHRGDCPRVNEISNEFRIRLPTTQKCLNEEGWPCETCQPLQRQ